MQMHSYVRPGLDIKDFKKLKFCLCKECGLVTTEQRFDMHYCRNNDDVISISSDDDDDDDDGGDTDVVEDTGRD